MQNEISAEDAIAAVVDDVPTIRTCFIVCPIGAEGDEVRRRSDQVKRHIIDPVMAELGYQTVRSDLVDESGLIGTHIVNQLLTADLVVADLTGSNPNVFYELALRHAFGKPFIQIIDKSERLPFDVAGQRSIFFDYRDLDSAAEARARLGRAAALITDGGDDYKAESPVSQTVDLQQLRSSGTPEQVTMAHVSESLSEIRAELRGFRPAFSRPQASLTSDQWSVLRQALLAMAKEGRFTRDDLSLLDTAPGSKTFDAFKQALDTQIAEYDDPWGSSKARLGSKVDDEPPF